jgi:hypothetical protein
MFDIYYGFSDVDFKALLCNPINFKCEVKRIASIFLFKEFSDFCSKYSFHAINSFHFVSKQKEKLSNYISL